MKPAAHPATQHRLRKHPEYQRVYGAARKQWAKQIAYFSALRAPGSQAALRSQTTGPRIGLTVPKALGKAVDRNRMKRRLRELVREALPLLAGIPVDVILHPKRSVLEAEFSLLEREVALIFKSVRARHATQLGALTATPGGEEGHAGDAGR